MTQVIILLFFDIINIYIFVLILKDIPVKIRDCSFSGKLMPLQQNTGIINIQN